MRLDHIFLALTILAAQSACTAQQGKPPDTRPLQEAASTPAPLTSFARLLPGEWKVTAQSGTSMFHTWNWGPGQHSIRRMTDGLDAGGNPWRELRVAYWHPGRREVAWFGLSPYREGLMEGTIRFEGESADAFFDLYQTGVLRKMRLRWAFDGPDRYREALLEAAGPDGFMPLAEWEHVRSSARTAKPQSTAPETSGPPSRWKALQPLLGHTWEAQIAGTSGDAFPTRTTFEWIPQVDAIYARVLAPTKAGEAAHLLDAYLYRHTGTGSLRCVALSDRGGVYEGDLNVLEDGAWELDLTGDEGDRALRHAVRFDFEPDGTLRQRVWALEGAERALRLDLRHRKIEPQKG